MSDTMVNLARDLNVQRSTSNVQRPTLPVSRVPINVRAATMDDLSFIDALQKMHTKQVGFMPEKALVGKINAGHVLIADEPRASASGEGQENADSSLAPNPSPLAPVPAGYVIGNDQYFKRDDVGIIYQMNVAPDRQRGLIGASLVKAMFDRAAYGCKLFCCWCAQDIEANRFWEALGFVPLAFRAGSREKGRVHIFWQKRIRAGDNETPWWFPSETKGGSIREDRLVFPIPPGTSWSDAKPIILPGAERGAGVAPARFADQKRGRDAHATLKKPPRPEPRGLYFPFPKEAAAAKPKREPRQKLKNDPKFVAAARELRDRWLEHVNADPTALPNAQTRYQVCKQIEAPAALTISPALPAPIAA